MRCPDLYVVICQVLPGEEDDPIAPDARYVLATRRTFARYPDAVRYAAGIAEARAPIVVSGDFRMLRWPD